MNLGTVALVVATFTLVAAGCGNSSQDVRLPPPPSMQAPPATGVSATAKAKALTVASRDPVVARLLRRGGIRTVNASRWLPGDVNLRITLKRAIDVEHVVLPYAIVPPDAPSKGDCRQPYARGWLRIDARAVTAMQVLVDLHQHRVADVDVNGADRRASAASGRPHGSCDEIEGG